MKKVRAAAVIAVVTTAVSQAREYAREHPDEAAAGLDRVEDFLRGRTAAKHASFLDKGSAALRQGLGLPRRSAAPGATTAAAATTLVDESGLTDPDPDTTEPPATYGFRDPVAPNPSPGTSDDPQPRRWDDDPAPLTPGERPRH
ncbi:MAG TPA: antitoxin [Ornithinibacter sp.]|nr:antitoxin [Ornithinibacter sp.]